MRRSRQSSRCDGWNRLLRPFHAVAVLFALSLGPGSARAQEEDPGGMRLRLGISQGIEAGRNLGLETPAAGNSLLATTGLSAEFVTETRLQRFALSTEGLLRFGSEDGTSVQGFDDPRLRFSYTRLGARSALELAGDWRRSDVDFLRSLADFTDADGVITLPEDFENLTGSGTRTERGLNGRLEFGIDMPLGLVLEARTREISYEDTTDPDLYDTRREGLDATLRMEVSPVATARLRLGQDRYEADDAEQTRRVTDLADLGLVYAVSPILNVEVGLGWRDIESRESGVITREQGLTGQLGFDLARPDGRIGLRFALDRDQTGERQSVYLDRVLERPLGEIRGGLGLTRGDGGDTDVIGDLSLRRDLPSGAITARLARSVTTTDDDESRLRTLLSVGWQHEINPVSQLVLRLDHSISGATLTEAKVERTDLSATYSRLLTQDWALNMGAGYSFRDEEGVGSARAPRVFLSVGRQFDFGL